MKTATSRGGDSLSEAARQVFEQSVVHVELGEISEKRDAFGQPERTSERGVE